MEPSVQSLRAMQSRQAALRVGASPPWVPDLDSCLKKNAGWKQTSFPCSKGSVVIWYDNQGGQLTHTALSRGDGTIDQHNPSRCGTSGSWGSNYCLTPPSFIEISNNTAPDAEVSVGYSPSAAVSWADSHCALDDGTECGGDPWCAEFV